MNVIGGESDLVRLVRNHEVRDVPPNGTVPFGPNPYDAVGPAGTTTLEVRLRSDGQAKLVRQFASLTGTFTNCAHLRVAERCRAQHAGQHHGEPRGGLVLCEDGSGTNLVRGLTRNGLVFDLARNDASGSEWAGACFSPQGRTLFVNIQGETRPRENPAGVKGMTFAIWGPWDSGAL